MSQYLDIGIPAQKMVLGLPWYGYRYPCNASMGEKDRYCPLSLVPFRGAPCSDAAGTEINYSDIYAQLQAGNTTTGRQWDALLQAPWFNFRDSHDVYQMWYDDPESLSIKLQGAKDAGLGGVGVWNFDALAYNATDPATAKAMQAMWNTFDVFLK